MMTRASRPKYFIGILLIFCFIVCLIYLYLAHLQFRRSSSRIPVSPIFRTSYSSDFPLPLEPLEARVVDLWARNRRMPDLTPLGQWLLSLEGTPPPRKTVNDSKMFLILVWEHGKFLERRHLRRFSRDKIFSAWEGCSVANCNLTYESQQLDEADAVIFHMHKSKSASSLPRRKNFSQRWIFLSDESPINTFLFQAGQKISDYDGLFNWSMSYRMNSDVPVPYGRVILRPSTSARVSNDFSRKKLVAILGSNCSGSNNRWRYVEQLKIILGDDFDILGRCPDGNRTICPGHFDVDCPALENYKFYLAFENSNCREYISEKVWWNAYEKNSVPVIMGAPKVDCERLLPPNSYLHVDDFADPASLAAKLLHLHYDPQAYGKLHSWRLSHRVINEHGYFGSPSKHYCRVCEALNYNSPLAKSYDSLNDFLDTERDCSQRLGDNKSALG